MKNSVIEMTRVAKRYTRGRKLPYYALRDTITGFVKAITAGQNKSADDDSKEFWALQDITFSVNQGEIFGIIGANGAGKSTVLKLLSRITPPTAGRIVLRGRVASLLEVGTGFNPELTGRENIFLNGAILGMSRTEIKKKFDDIVSFAETESFLDTPVKYYSSGMYTRLAFAVAAHLESEILLVDEVLAVGDAAFQKKCLGKMEQIGQEGRTIIFVSHNMAAIQSLCPKAVLLERGKIRSIGNTHEVINYYLKNIQETVQKPVNKRIDRVGKGKIVMTDVRFLDCRGQSTYAVGDDIHLRVSVRSYYLKDKNVRLSISVFTENQQGLISCDSLQKNETYTIAANRTSYISFKLLSPLLNYGTYFINMAVFLNNEPEDWINSLARFKIDSGTFDGIIPEERFNPILAKYRFSISL